MATNYQDLAAKLWQKVDNFKNSTTATPGFVVAVVRHQMAQLETRHGRRGSYDRVLDAINKIDGDVDPIEKWDEQKGAFVDAHARVEDLLLNILADHQELQKYLAANDDWYVGKIAVIGARPADLGYLKSGRSFSA